MIYTFENYALDTGRRELRRGGDILQVEPKVFDLLQHLVANHDRVVSKEDLISSVWSGRIVSESAIATCINLARSALDDSGDAQRLIKTLPRKGVRFMASVQKQGEPTFVREAALGPPKAELALPDRPSLAVLPFVDASAVPEHDYFADGVVDEIITALSQMRWLFVIARTSSFTYKGKAVDVAQVGRELGVRYVLEGSVRRSTERIRIAARLVDCASRTNLSTYRFETSVEDIFELQDKVAAGVIAAIEPKLEKVEITRAQRKPAHNLDAYDCYLRGLARYYPWTREAQEEALALFNKAIAIDPEYASAYAMAARCYAARMSNGWIVDQASERAEAMRLARTAAALGGDDAAALSIAGFTAAHLASDFAAGAALIDRALELNPNLAMAWQYSGWVKVWSAKAAAALEDFARAMRLNPVDPKVFTVHCGIAAAHFVDGRYAEGADWAERTLREDPNYAGALRIAAACYGLSGQRENARSAVERMKKVDPGARIGTLTDRTPHRGETLARLTLGLRRAGVPE